MCKTLTCLMTGIAATGLLMLLLTFMVNTARADETVMYQPVRPLVFKEAEGIRVCFAVGSYDPVYCMPPILPTVEHLDVCAYMSTNKQLDCSIEEKVSEGRGA